VERCVTVLIGRDGYRLAMADRTERGLAAAAEAVELVTLWLDEDDAVALSRIRDVAADPRAAARALAGVLSLTEVLLEMLADDDQTAADVLREIALEIQS
jgi:hypothetical protein